MKRDVFWWMLFSTQPFDVEFSGWPFFQVDDCSRTIFGWPSYSAEWGQLGEVGVGAGNMEIITYME